MAPGTQSPRDYRPQCVHTCNTISTLAEKVNKTDELTQATV
jgi:hypothetical protein